MPLAVALYRDSTPVVALHPACLSADMYTYVTVVATEGAEKPQAARPVVPDIAEDMAANTLLTGVVLIAVLPVLGKVAGRAFVRRGPLNTTQGVLVGKVDGATDLVGEVVRVTGRVPAIEFSGDKVAAGEGMTDLREVGEGRTEGVAVHIGF